MSLFLKMEDRKVKQVLSGDWCQWVGGRYEKGFEGGWIWWKYVLTYENGKMGPGETILRMGGEEIKEYDDGGGSN
jgi:hypothetical protein